MGPFTKILVADDDPDIRSIVAHALRKMGYDPVETVSGEEAIALLKVKSFGLVVLDLKLPGIGGEEVVKTIRAEHPQLPILVITGFPERAEQAAELDVQGWLYKPFELQTLRSEVQRVLTAS